MTRDQLIPLMTLNGMVSERLEAIENGERESKCRANYVEALGKLKGMSHADLKKLIRCNAIYSEGIRIGRAGCLVILQSKDREDCVVTPWVITASIDDPDDDYDDECAYYDKEPADDGEFADVRAAIIAKLRALDPDEVTIRRRT